jgi:hypothetical protein
MGTPLEFSVIMYFSIYVVKVCSLLYVTDFVVFSFHGTELRKKNGGVAIDEPPQGPASGPVDHSWNRAFCYGLPVPYKFFQLLFK